MLTGSVTFSKLWNMRIVPSTDVLRPVTRWVMGTRKQRLIDPTGVGFALAYLWCFSDWPLFRSCYVINCLHWRQFQTRRKQGRKWWYNVSPFFEAREYAGIKAGTIKDIRNLSTRLIIFFSDKVFNTRISEQKYDYCHNSSHPAMNYGSMEIAVLK